MNNSSLLQDLCGKIGAEIICQGKPNNVKNLGKKISGEKNKMFFLVYLDGCDTKLVLLKGSITRIKYYLKLERERYGVSLLGIIAL